MDSRKFAFGKENFILLAVALVIIVIGFCLMLGGATNEETGFNPDIFSIRRIVIAPIVAMIGFITVIWAILKKTKDEKNQSAEN